MFKECKRRWWLFTLVFCVFLTGCDLDDAVKGFYRKVRFGAIDVVVVSFYDQDCNASGNLKNPWYCTAETSKLIRESIIAGVQEMQRDQSMNVRFIKLVDDPATVNPFYKNVMNMGLQQRTEEVRRFARSQGGNLVLFGLYYSDNNELRIAPVINWHLAGKDVQGQVKSYSKPVTEQDNQAIMQGLSSEIGRMLRELY